MSERTKGYIACVLILAALVGLVYLNMRYASFTEFSTRELANRSGQCP